MSLHKYTQTRVMQLSLRQSDCIYSCIEAGCLMYIRGTYQIFEKMIFAKVSLTLMILKKVRAQRAFVLRSAVEKNRLQRKSKYRAGCRRARRAPAVVRIPGAHSLFSRAAAIAVQHYDRNKRCVHIAAVAASLLAV